MNESKTSERNKNVAVKFHHGRKLVKSGVLRISQIRSEVRPVYIMTEAVSQDHLGRLSILCSLQ